MEHILNLSFSKYHDAPVLTPSFSNIRGEIEKLEQIRSDLSPIENEKTREWFEGSELSLGRSSLKRQGERERQLLLTNTKKTPPQIQPKRGFLGKRKGNVARYGDSFVRIHHLGPFISCSELVPGRS